MGLPARLDLVLRFGLEIAGVMALAQLSFRRPAGAVDHSPALDGRALADFFRPARQVFVFVRLDRKSTRLNSSHLGSSYAVFCLKKKKLNYRKLQLSCNRNLTYKLVHASFERSSYKQTLVWSTRTEKQEIGCTVYQRTRQAADET